MIEFRKEVKEMSTADLILVLEDQTDLYNEAELKILREELSFRYRSSKLKGEELKRTEILLSILEEQKREEIEKEIEIRKQKEKQEQERQAREQLQREYNYKIENLKKMGLDGYYEYKVVSLYDESGLFNKKSGAVDTQSMTQLLNILGLEGWHLVTAYSNELGKNTLSGGMGGVMSGINSTIDENILIFERFVKISQEQSTTTNMS